MSKKKNQEKKKISSETKKDIVALIIFLIALLSFLSMFELTGHLDFLSYFWRLIFGWLWWLVPFILILIGYHTLSSSNPEPRPFRWIGLLILILSADGIFHLLSGKESFSQINGEAGGAIGFLVGFPLFKIASFWGALVILFFLFLIAVLFLFETSFSSIKEGFYFIFNKIKSWFVKSPEDDFNPKDIENYNAEEEEEEDNIEEDEENEYYTQEIDTENKNQKTITESTVNKKTKSYKKYPHIDLPLNLLQDKKEKPGAGDIKNSQQIIKETLANFGIDVEMGEVAVGPTVTQFTFKPASGVKVSQITTLSNDLALALAAHPIRIEAPIPGKALVGIEVPNQKIATVTLKEILMSPQFKERKTNLSLALGKNVAGKAKIANLDKMPHLLVAGTTGSGKTVCLNSLIISLLYQNQPDELKLILVDPKQVEMTQYNGIPHLKCKTISGVKETVNALRWSVKEMEERFQTLAESGQRNIHSYNQKNPDKKMPYLVIIIDELADLMTTAAQDIEQAIIRLAQKARAVGIHLILATQRPSVNVITGLIKANISSRIAFKVTSGSDSRTILDHSGADKLIGQGDMLFITSDISKPVRIQGAFLDDEEINQVVEYLKQQGEPEYEEEITEKQKSSPTSGFSSVDDDEDELLPEAKELVVKAGKASSSYLQRRLRIGYARAARLLDLLEEAGVVGPAEGSKPREILIKSLEDLEDNSQDQELSRLEKTNQEINNFKQNNFNPNYNQDELNEDDFTQEEQDENKLEKNSSNNNDWQQEDEDD